MSRFEEVVNDAIGEVVLSERVLRAETLAHAHRREGPRPPGRAPRRGPHRGALPRAQARPRLRHPDAGALHAARHRRRLRGRHAPADRRPRAGHHRVPVRAGARPGLLARAPARRRLRRGRDRAHLRAPSPSPRTTSAGSARCRSAARRTASTDIDAERLLAIVEESMSSEIYELMKRSDEGAVVEKAHRRPRFVEDCVREMIRGVIDGFPELTRPPLRVLAPGEPGDDPPAQRRRRALRAARRAAPRGGLRRASEHHVSAREWLDGRA